MSETTIQTLTSADKGGSRQVVQQAAAAPHNLADKNPISSESAESQKLSPSASSPKQQSATVKTAPVADKAVARETQAASSAAVSSPAPVKSAMTGTGTVSTQKTQPQGKTAPQAVTKPLTSTTQPAAAPHGTPKPAPADKPSQAQPKAPGEKPVPAQQKATPSKPATSAQSVPAKPNTSVKPAVVHAAAPVQQQTSSKAVAQSETLPPLVEGPHSPAGFLLQYSRRVEHFFRPQGLPWRLIVVCVLIPTVIVFLYLALFASNIYLTETKFAIRSQNQQQSLDMLSTFFRAGTSTLSDSYIVQNYIESMDMIDKVDARLHIKEHYSGRTHDIWYRLEQNPTQDEMLRYWSWAVVPSFDPDTSIMTVEVKAFSPQMAQAVCQAILDFSEDLVNAMNNRARNDAIALAQAEVGRAEQRIRAAQEAMRQYRERTVILDPQAVATGLYSLVNQLEGEITKTTAELAEAMTYMQTDSPRVVMLQNRLEVLQKQLQTEKARLASQMQGDKPLSALVSEFQSLTLEEEFAQRQLTSAMASLETARVQAESKSLYVESFQKPIVPDESLYPRPVVFSLIFMLAAAVLLGLVSLIIAAIREHAGF